MEFKNLQLEDVIVLEDKKRKPLSTMDRSKRKGIYPYYGAQEIIDSIDDYIFDGKYILLAEDGENLKSRKKDLVKIVEGKFWLNNHAHIFKVKENVDLEYLYYYLLKLDLGEYITGSTQPKLNQENMNKIKIKLPELKIQRKISKILSNIDGKIKLNNEINNNLYEEAVALYKDKFKGIGQGKKTIGDYIVPKRGKNLLTRDAIDGDTPVVAGGIAPSAYHNQFNTKSPVITISASGANAGYTNLWNIPVWASDCSYIDDSITKNVYFWYIVLKSRQNEIFDAQTGSAQPHIYPQHIAEMSIGELNIAEVEKYNNLVEPLFKMIGENQKENKKLSQLRDILLPKLMNGEIDLDNIEI